MSKDNETRVNTPRIENAAQAFGIGASRPRLSWTVATPRAELAPECIRD